MYFWLWNFESSNLIVFGYILFGWIGLSLRLVIVLRFLLYFHIEAISS